jgi:hypothetical protein
VICLLGVGFWLGVDVEKRVNPSMPLD